MAVGYQYQSDYDNKQVKKGFKKKFIILGVGLSFLAFIAIVGAPKKEAITNNTTGSLGSLDTGQNDVTAELQQAKSNSNSFVEGLVKNKDVSELFYDESIRASDFMQFVGSNPGVIDFSCEYVSYVGFADLGKTLPSFKYRCSKYLNSENMSIKFLFIAIKKDDDNKIFSWYASSDDSIQKFINNIHGED